MFHPVSTRVLVLRRAPKTTSEGGLVIPERAQEQRDFGTVVAAGAEVKEVEVGDEIAYAGYAGTQVRFDKDELLQTGLAEGEYLILEERDILGVFK